MAGPTYIKNVAIVGVILRSLISARRFKITAITREGSTPKFPFDKTITVRKGDYESASFLHSAFTGQDAVLFVLSGPALIQPQTKLIEAAAAAGVKWILPTEYGTDSAHEELTRSVPINALKLAPRLRLEELTEIHEGLHWIGIITNFWFDFGLKVKFFKIDVSARTATLLDDGTGKFNTTTVRTVGLAVASLLSLPEESASGPSLSDFKDGFCYISSFLTSQKEILEAVMRVTGTGAGDWKVEKLDAAQHIEEGKEKLAKGDFLGGVTNLLSGMAFKGGKGGDYESFRGVSNQVLGLPKENLDDAVKHVLDQVASKTGTF